MKLKFDKDLEYQQEAISSVVDLFKGNNRNHGIFTVNAYDEDMILADNTIGISNKLTIDRAEILKNLQEIQLRNGLPQTKSLGDKTLNFDIEMETGTGKTYVYTRTILELNKLYGFTKFIIVVPSIAIKEGVNKSLEITREHFRTLYDNTIYNFFIYDSSKLDQVRSFAVSDHIEIMIINIDAFRRSFVDPTKENKANIIHRPNDRLNGMKPIELIQETRPFVIIDEPQSVDNTPKAQEAIKSLNPLCIFRYSATHRRIHKLVYKLDAVDSYDQKLVKQIEVASFAAKDYYNKVYLRLISVNNKKSPITAKIEMDIKNNKGVVDRKIVTVRRGDDLFEKSNGRDIYNNYIVEEIYCEKGFEYLSFTSKPDILKLGKTIGGFDDEVIKNNQIKKTIMEHLDKELELEKHDIKVLSLFFIDKVSNYRYYDEDGNPQKGRYAQIFEEHYQSLINLPKYRNLHYKDTKVEDVHNGYFAADKKGIFKDTSGLTQDDDSVYNLIMKDKEKLLSFDTNLRFIFSHSALREGWDNPNVFQICTLNETQSEMKKRQEIGRGLRLCVNKAGERQHGFDINTLTVMANESYEEFASALQKEYEEDAGIKFGVIEKHAFAKICMFKDEGSENYLGIAASEQIHKEFLFNNYIDENNKVQEELKVALKKKSLIVSEEFEPYIQQISNIAEKACKTLNIKNADDKKKVNLNKVVYLDPEFKTLWNKIKYKTTYSVEFDSEELIKKCCKKMIDTLSVNAPKLSYAKGKLDITNAGIVAEEQDRYSVSSERVNDRNVKLPDIIGYLQNETYLTRKTIVEILIKSGTLDKFILNAQVYMEQVAAIINSTKKLMIVDGIKYTKIGNEEYYAQELFEENELFGYLNKNMIASRKSVYDHVVYDSINEESFATNFEKNKSIKLYAKLPSWFIIATPLGSYNPDWVILIEKDGESKLYLVVETKGSTDDLHLRPSEKAKIDCGKKHFAALGEGVIFEVKDDFKKLMDEI
ncbi:MAG: DEAD/DEAH box helicase family protein [Candidatus Cloacimonadales bacterium]|jgi:type III restriction enzyme|nr:DEAD/DEAH box helicase family protein [Candidatus Cloacimonadales bacterium]